MSFIEHVMTICERVLGQAEQQKNNSSTENSAPSPPRGAPINSQKKVH